MDTNAKILLSALASDVIPSSKVTSVVSTLTMSHANEYVDIQGIARAFHNPKLLRQLRTSKHEASGSSYSLNINEAFVTYETYPIGQTQILYKSPFPGELQARLAIESIIDRFLDYLLKEHQIVVLNESDRHVQVFIPGQTIPDFEEQWDKFLKKVAFSAFGDSRLQMPGLVQTFIIMLNAVTLSGRGFSTLDVPILTKEQAEVLAAWYFAVIQQVDRRQRNRQKQIDSIQEELKSSDLKEKERQSKEKELDDKEVMQAKEAKKYTENFEKSFAGLINNQTELWKELHQLDTKLSDSSLPKKDQRKLYKQRDKVASKITFPEKWLLEKRSLLKEIGCQPFKFVFRDRELHSEKFQSITEIAKRFDRKATDQINSTRGDIFTQCITEMYRLLELDEKDLDSLPPPLLASKPPLLANRLAGDDSKEFCYSCGVGLDPKKAKWQVLRFMFERPSQRRQSSNREGRPHICASCSALAFASPLKVTDESIILRLLPIDQASTASIKLQDYVRMLTSKEVHLSAGKYIVLTSDRTNKGDLAASKLGQVQYALAKVASIFPQEVLKDFRFKLILQGSDIELRSRHLLFIKGLMESYGQSIIIAGKEINISLGDAIRYIQQDLPYLADYSLVKVSSISNHLMIEQTRSIYWEELKGFMDSNSRLTKRAKLYQDVAALTGLTYAFVESLERVAEKSLEQQKDPKYTAREVGKIIEKADDVTAFCYYATLGGEEKKDVQARLYHNSRNDFIYNQTLILLKNLAITGREDKTDQGGKYIQLYADDVAKVYIHFASQKEYEQEKDWKELTYNLKLSLYTRFPELVRKLKSTSEKN
ncbi:hypothetical protein [Leptothoe spongobia]|uniref:Uncharacterized protein n=1 Tax=Leptothoe spongobia TAU-MAC 1115 TaxID=1967444 RepID=A0A947DFB1_9CYAN|nr:hypothetical protein [Leptothoe spongobia]MBT9314856.1 hypothetical protein [Leptothoe spongobia TAU-MAC 1115]